MITTTKSTSDTPHVVLVTLDTPTVEEIEGGDGYPLKPWYVYMPVAIQLKRRLYTTVFEIDELHTPDEKGFSTMRERMDWKAERKGERYLRYILEDGEEWAEFVAGMTEDALHSWANDHLFMRKTLSAEKE